ncbi:MAG: mercuric reductase [Anaerolineae bacterium]
MLSPEGRQLTQMTTSTEQYDAIIIGTGQAASPLARALNKSGKRTAVIEREHVGGTCINEGCTPTKTMVASARVAYLTRRAADYGVNTGGAVSVDMAAVRQRKRDIVESWSQGTTNRLMSAENVDLILGEGRFTGPHEVEVALNEGGTRRLAAGMIFINTGARPHIPSIAGLADVPYFNSTTIMELGDVPEHLVILGGGYVGLEFGQMFRRFGSMVTIVQRSGQLLPREDADIAEAVTDILREDGIQVVLNATARRVTPTADGGVALDSDTPDGAQTVTGSHLLVATGRTPNSDRLNLEAAGVATDAQGYIKVNDRLETNVPGVYALGDVKGGPQFTHIAYDDYRIVCNNLLKGKEITITDRLVPYCVFIDPQLGRVGLTEREALTQGRRIRVAKMPMSHVARALEVDEPRGLMKAIVDASTGQILGCAILGIEGGEIMAILQVAMMGGLPYTALRDGVFAHPTLAEALNNLFLNLDDMRDDMLHDSAVDELPVPEGVRDVLNRVTEVLSRGRNSPKT